MVPLLSTPWFILTYQITRPIKGPKLAIGIIPKPVGNRAASKSQAVRTLLNTKGNVCRLAHVLVSILYIDFSACPNFTYVKRSDVELQVLDEHQFKPLIHIS